MEDDDRKEVRAKKTRKNAKPKSQRESSDEEPKDEKQKHKRRLAKALVSCGAKGGKKLDLRQAELIILEEGSLPSSYPLTHLLLDENKLSSLPADVSNFKDTLHVLSLGHNCLADLTTIQTTLSTLSTLTSLELNKNNITEIPKDCFKSLAALLTLSLDDNSLKAFPIDSL